MHKYFPQLFKFCLVFAILIMLTSCASKKKIHYLQESVGEIENVLNYENTIQPDDNLLITVTAPNAELIRDFNLMFLYSQSTDMRSSGNDAPYTYLVDKKGEIDFPIIGKLKLGGLTRLQAESLLRERISKYVNNPGINLRVTNFKVSVIGEVSRPGQVPVVGDRITIFEALSAAGDLSIYGKRKEVMIIREKDNVKTIAHVDITKPEIITGPYYYLAHNDVIYVKPNQTRVNSSVIGPNLGLALSTISLLITIITLTTK